MLMAGMGILGIFVGFRVQEKFGRSGLIFPFLLSILFFALGVYLSWLIVNRYVGRDEKENLSS